MHATIILNQSVVISLSRWLNIPLSLKPRPFLLVKGKMLFQNRTTTASIAPSWITTSNMLQNPSETFLNANIFSKRIRCPVLLIGSHSVMPSTIPNIMALIISIMIYSCLIFTCNMSYIISYYIHF